jgi:hypothetical protein
LLPGDLGGDRFNLDESSGRAMAVAAIGIGRPDAAQVFGVRAGGAPEPV